MNIFLDEKIRLVIPRWRDYRTTVRLDELGYFKSRILKREQSDRDSLTERIHAWETNRTTSFASDLVGAAFVIGEYEKASEAARFLLSEGCNASNVAKEIARKILGIAEPTLLGVESEICNPQSTEMRKRLHNLRIQLRNDPRNSIVWADISRIYAILGLKHKAPWAMDIALKISPVNRYILRSAARLHLHLKDPERAHYLLRHAQSIRHDPWVMAAEISVALIMDKTSRLVNLGSKMLQSKNYLPSHITELASAIGTLELRSGNRKTARKLFQQALIKPNENTVAQACWASKRLKAFELDEVYLKGVPLSFEARYIKFSQAKEWEKAVNETRLWLYDQPFSARPAIQGSYIAGIAVEDYVESARIAECGLLANPRDPTLLNNLAFALANQENRIDEAERVFSGINVAELHSHMQVAWHATNGLIMYRKGYPDKGREYYNRAIKMASDLKDKSLKARAAIYLAREEKLCRSSLAESATASAIDYCRGLPDPEIEILLKRVVEQS